MKVIKKGKKKSCLLAVPRVGLRLKLFVFYGQVSTAIKKVLFRIFSKCLSTISMGLSEWTRFNPPPWMKIFTQLLSLILLVDFLAHQCFMLSPRLWSRKVNVRDRFSHEHIQYEYKFGLASGCLWSKFDFYLFRLETLLQ